MCMYSAEDDGMATDFHEVHYAQGQREEQDLLSLRLLELHQMEESAVMI